MYFYYNSKYPENKIMFFEENDSCMKRFFNTVQWLFILLFWGINCSYLTYVLIWMILGAIIDPNKYLVLATSALTIVIFIRSRYIKVENLALTYEE
jgi:hypothetical protein